MKEFMNKFILLVILLFPFTVYADPHYVQALHPYWGNDKNYLKYLEQFEGSVNVEVNKYEGSKDIDVGEDWYIYIYIVRDKNPSKFSINISCPKLEGYEFHTFNSKKDGLKRTKVEGVARIRDIVGSDPVRKNGPAEINNGSIAWPLDASGGPQGMWFYSQSPPTKRDYQLLSRKGVIKSGAIKGPSCQKN